MSLPALDEGRLREAVEVRGGPEWLSEYRRESLERYLASGFPTVRQEHWKYTNLAPVAELSEEWLVAPTDPGEDAAERDAWRLARRMLGDLDAHSVLFVDGRLELDSLPENLPEGARLEPLLDSGSAPDLPEDGDAMTALNGALLTDGLRLTLDETCVLDKPLYVLFIVTGNGSAVASPRLLIRAGGHSRASIVEHYAGTPDARRFTNAVTDLELDDAARLSHVRLQEQPPESLEVSRLTARLQARAGLDACTLDLGGRLVRHDVAVRLEGAEASVSLNGVYLTDGRRHVDNHTRIDHVARDTRSSEDYRGVLKDRSRAVFNGKVMVHAGADGTDASQSNRNLLLSDSAEVDTKPELEIYADDVKCSHGATVGQLDESALFYLRSRGLDTETARHLLIFAFLREVLTGAGNPALARRMERMLLGSLPEFAELETLL